jgi:hypothetical protein
MEALLGRMLQAGEQPVATLPLGRGVVGGAGALAVGTVGLWLAQPQLLGGPSVASTPLTAVGPSSCRASRFGGTVVEIELDGRRVRFSTPAARGDVEEFLRVLDAARG